jgi:tetratricopeptide (TPR) repeat protein
MITLTSRRLRAKPTPTLNIINEGDIGAFDMDELEGRAEAAESAGDSRLAFELWKEVVLRDGGVYPLLRYGYAAKALEYWEEAARAFSDAYRLEPELVQTLTALGSLWAYRTDKEDQESFEAAKMWFLKALKHERSPSLLNHLGATYLALEDNVAARSAFEEAIALNPRYEESLFNLANMEEETDLQKSLGLLERAIEVDPDYALAHQSLGRVCHKMGDLTKAEYHLRRSLEIDPANYWTNLYLADLLGVLGRISEAEQTYRFATNLHPELVGGLEVFANFLAEIGKTEEAAAIRAQMAGGPDPDDRFQLH